jgi:hypothetical protein
MHYFLRVRRTIAIESFSAAEISASPVMTCAGFGIPDSRPSHASSSARSAIVNRPSRLTGIPAFAHLWAVAELKPKEFGDGGPSLQQIRPLGFRFRFRHGRPNVIPFVLQCQLQKLLPDFPPSHSAGAPGSPFFWANLGLHQVGQCRRIARSITRICQFSS